MAADTSGMFSEILRVSLVLRLVSRGRTLEKPGTRSTSSNVSACWIRRIANPIGAKADYTRILPNTSLDNQSWGASARPAEFHKTAGDPDASLCCPDRHTAGGGTVHHATRRHLRDPGRRAMGHGFSGPQTARGLLAVAALGGALHDVRRGVAVRRRADRAFRLAEAHLARHVDAACAWR